MSWRSFLPLSLALLACGGGPPPESAADVDSDPSSETDSDTASSDSEASPREGDGNSSGDSEKPAKAAPDAAPAGEASQNDVRDILQLVVEDEALNPYLHLEQPKRFPLKVSGSAYPQGVEVTKATEPVVFVAKPKADEAVLVFTEIEVKGEQASVRYRFDIEGVRGSATLHKRNGRWELKSSRVTER